MSLTSIIIIVAVGFIVGWLAGQIWKGGGFGFLGNVAVGIVGSFLGRFLFGLAGISLHGHLGTFIPALVGALVLLWILGMIRK